MKFLGNLPGGNIYMRVNSESGLEFLFYSTYMKKKSILSLDK